MLTLLLATRNAHKAAEIRALLGGRIRYLTLNDFPGAPNVVEDAGSFAGNAVKKAVELARWKCEVGSAKCGVGREETVFVLADDSGLEVDALHGAPGVHSARFAALESGQAGNSSDADNCAKLLWLLKDVPAEQRTARFRCLAALTPAIERQVESVSPVCYADAFALATRVFEGLCEGRIGFEPRGRNGFGYDPLFIPTGLEQTFAELGDDVKNRLSHRARALEKLQQYLRNLP